jgi:hypothetical protein
VLDSGGCGLESDLIDRSGKSGGVGEQGRLLLMSSEAADEQPMVPVSQIWMADQTARGAGHCCLVAMTNLIAQLCRMQHLQNLHLRLRAPAGAMGTSVQHPLYAGAVQTPSGNGWTHLCPARP